MTLAYGGDSQLWHVDEFSENQNWISREGKSCPPSNSSVHFCDWDPLRWLSWDSVVLGNIQPFTWTGNPCTVTWAGVPENCNRPISCQRLHLYMYIDMKDSEEENAFLYLKTTSFTPQSDKKSFSFANFFPATSLKLCVRKWVLAWYVLACFSNKSGSFIVGSGTQLIM